MGIIIGTNMNEISQKKPKISIGLFVYNEEEHIKKRLENILSQTYSNFELIVSDNCSNDSTLKICEEFLNKDKRIKIFKHKKNMGSQWNVNFVLEQSTSEYFIWAQADDILNLNFLEENLKILEKNKNFVGSISKVERFGPVIDAAKIDDSDSFKTRLYKKIRKKFIYFNTRSILGVYEKRIREYLKEPDRNNLLFSLFRTRDLKQCIVSETFAGNDFAIVLNILKFGEINVIDQVMMYKYSGGMSGNGMISLMKELEHSLIGLAFPHYPITSWCIVNLGWKIFFKNFDSFIKLNFNAEFALLLDIMRILKNKLI